LILAYIDHVFLQNKDDFIMIVGSFGAQAVLVFAAPSAPLAQPWNCIVGNIIGSSVGVSSYKFFNEGINKFENLDYLAAACAVSITIVLMLLTKSLHPPAGATALIAVLGSKRVHDLGYMYVLFPSCIGSCIFVLLGVILNNASSQEKRQYPVVWAPVMTSSLFTIGRNEIAQAEQKKEPYSEGIIQNTKKEESKPLFKEAILEITIKKENEEAI
jgi:CBS-domain-containing membrane protein